MTRMNQPRKVMWEGHPGRGDHAGKGPEVGMKWEASGRRVVGEGRVNRGC